MEHQPPLPEADAIRIFRPHFPRLHAAVERARVRIRHLVDTKLIKGVTNITLMSAAQNLAVDEIKEEFAPEVAAGKIGWHDQDLVSYMRIDGVALRCNKVDEDILPCRKSTNHSIKRWSQGVLFNDLFGMPGEPQTIPEITLGLQWTLKLDSVVVYLVALFQGDRIYAIPVTNIGRTVAPIHELQPKKQPKAARVRSTKTKAREARNTQDGSAG